MNEMRKLMDVAGTLLESSGGTSLEELAREMETGSAPEVANASYSRGNWSWGDLKRLGFARRHQENAGGGMINTWWELLPSAPGPITVITMGSSSPEVLQPGEQTEPVEWDPT